MSIEKKANVIADIFREFVESQVAPLRAELADLRTRCAELQTRCAELESRGYKGTWKPDTTYSPGVEVTYDGKPWHCWTETRDRPPSPAWQLKAHGGRRA
jgi:hypothetical protein